MNKHTSELLHDEAMHEAMRKLTFLAGLMATIVVLHRILYHMAF